MSGYSQEVKFCVKYLLDHGIDSLSFPKVVGELSPEDKKFDFVPVDDKNRKAFFDELAAKLREMWPPGEKSGKYPWRDSVPNLSRRLQVLWSERMKDKDYTIEQCVAAAQKYLSQFEEDTTYMQLLKYFIMKQEHIAKPNKHLEIINKSVFADILEGMDDQNNIENEWKRAFEEPTYYEGEII